jgi:protein required for attachment to host cells
MHKKWVIVLSRAKMKVFECDQVGQLSHLLNLVDEDGHVRGRDLIKHSSGSRYEGGHSPSFVRNMTSGSGDKPKQLASEDFARKIVQFLRNEHAHGHVQELVVIAEPSFLGMIKKTMDEQTQKIVSDWLIKDLEKSSTSNLMVQLQR